MHNRGAAGGACAPALCDAEVLAPAAKLTPYVADCIAAMAEVVSKKRGVTAPGRVHGSEGLNRTIYLG